MKANVFARLLIAIVIALICFYGLFLRAKVFQNRDYNPDETDHFNYAMSAGFEPFWQRLYYGDELICFPGYYLTTVPFIKIFTYNKWGVAIPHILSTLLGFWFLFLICQRWFKTHWGTLITFFLFATHRELIYHAFELRPYALLPTIGLMSLYFLEMVISPRFTLSHWTKIWLLLLFIFIINYHSYGILIFGVCSIFLFFRESIRYSWRVVYKRNLPFYGLLGLLALPLWLWYNSGNVYRTDINTFAFIANPLIHPGVFFREIIGNLVGNRTNYIFLFCLLSQFFYKPIITREKISYLLILIVLPIELILLADVLSHYWFIQRQFIWVMPYFAIFIGWCWDSMLSEPPR